MKILINHFIDYKNCNIIEYKYYYNENNLNIFKFIKIKNEIYNEISILMKLDFAQDNRLLIEIRNRQDDYIKDNWEKYLKNSLDHMTMREWRKSSSKIKELFINNKKSKYLIINKNDIFIKDIYKRNIIKN